MQKLFTDFIREIQKEKDKEKKAKIVLALTDDQFRLVSHIYDRRRIPVTKLEFKELMQDIDIDRPTELNSLIKIIDYMYEPECDKGELARAIMMYLDFIEGLAGWRKCRDVSKLLFKETRLGIKRREIRRLGKERKLNKS